MCPWENSWTPSPSIGLYISDLELHRRKVSTPPNYYYLCFYLVLFYLTLYLIVHILEIFDFSFHFWFSDKIKSISQSLLKHSFNENPFEWLFTLFFRPTSYVVWLPSIGVYGQKGKQRIFICDYPDSIISLILLLQFHKTFCISEYVYFLLWIYSTLNSVSESLESHIVLLDRPKIK